MLVNPLGGNAWQVGDIRDGATAKGTFMLSGGSSGWVPGI